MSRSFRRLRKRLHKKNPTSLMIILCVVIGILIAGVCLCVLYGYQAVQYKTKFIRSTYINQIAVGDLTAAQVESKLSDAAANYRLTVLFREDKSETISASDIDYAYVPDGEVEDLLSAQNPLFWMRGYFSKIEKTLSPSVTYNEDKLDSLVASLPEMQDENMTAPKDACVVYKDGSFSVAKEEAGTKLDKDKVLSLITEAVRTETTQLDLTEETGVYEEPKVFSDDEELAEDAAALTPLLKGSITLDLPSGSQVLDGNVTKDWLTRNEDGTWTKDEDKWNQCIKDYVSSLADKTDTVNKDHQFNATDLGEITVTGDEYYGWEIDQDKEIAQITQELSDGATTEREPNYKMREAADSDDNDGFGNTYVEVDLSRQHLWFYKDGSLLLDTDVVSGKMDEKHHTPEGLYYVLSMQSPAVLQGNYSADGTPGYTSHVSYWMQLTDDGVGMHDANWRSSFGGEIYIWNGSHGCINLPTSIADDIYSAITKETPVIVYYSEGCNLH